MVGEFPLNPRHAAYRLFNLTSRIAALHDSPPPNPMPMHHLLDRRVANHGGLESENFEIQTSKCRILFWVAQCFSKMQESNGGFS
jgi:hypothetical protein